MENQKTNRSLDRRRDHRSVEKFAQDIKEWTRKENIWADVIKVDLEERGHKVVWEDHGIDGSGELIRSVNKNIRKLDKKFVIDGKSIFVEIKTHDTGLDYNEIPFITVKTHSLYDTLAVYGRLIIVDRLYFMLLRPACIKRIIDNFEPKIYERFSPNDLAIRIHSKELSEMFGKEENQIDVRRWKPKAVALIEENAENLFKRR